MLNIKNNNLKEHFQVMIFLQVKEQNLINSYL